MLIAMLKWREPFNMSTMMIKIHHNNLAYMRRWFPEPVWLLLISPKWWHGDRYVMRMRSIEDSQSLLYLTSHTLLHKVITSNTSSDKALRSGVHLGKHSHRGILLSRGLSESGPSQWAPTFSSEKPAITPDHSAHLNRWKWRAIGWEKANFSGWMAQCPWARAGKGGGGAALSVRVQLFQ